MTLSSTMRMFLLGIAVLSGLVAGKRLVESFARDEIHRRDFIQEYVFAKAVLAGDDPYLKMPTMVKRYFDPAPEVNWGHPAPHTPVTAVLSIPLAWLDYPLAAFLWLVLELVLLVFVWAAFFRWWGEPISWQTRIALVLLSLSLGPVIQELWFGNLSMILLALLIPAWFSLRSGRDVSGGVWLGLAIAIKLTGWPVALFLLAKGRWRAVISVGTVVIGLHAIAAGVMGVDPVIDYYRRVGPGIARGYGQHDCNYSLWTIGERFFGEEFHPYSVINNFVVHPPLHVGWLARGLTYGLPILALAFGIVLALRCRDFDSSFGLLLCLSLPVNPVAWDHSLLIATIPMAIVLRRLSWLGWPRQETTLAVVCFALAMFPQQAYMRGLAAVIATDENGFQIMPFAVGLITYIPLVALIGWMFLLLRLDGVPKNA